MFRTPDHRHVLLSQRALRLPLRREEVHFLSPLSSKDSLSSLLHHLLEKVHGMHSKR